MTNTAASRREVVVNGRRVTVIDLHAHCAIPEALALLGQDDPFAPLLKENAGQRLQAMDEQGIDIEALSINPFWYSAERDLAAEVIRVQNEQLVEFCAVELGLRRALIGGSVNGEELADPKFHAFWAKAEELGALIFIHPQGTAELVGRLRGNGVLDNVIGNPLETTIALAHLIFEGTLDRFPRLKILAAHGGGYLPAYAARFDHGCRTFPSRCTAIAKQPSAYLKQLAFDSLVFTPEGLRHLVAETGARQIVLGTDYPYPWTHTAVDHVLNTPELSDEDRIAILGGNAARLLGIDA
jgi:aminocarboxymuconate-semialdehyde decarboxylase